MIMLQPRNHLQYTYRYLAHELELERSSGAHARANILN